MIKLIILTSAIVICIAIIAIIVVSIWREVDVFANLADSVF